MTDTPDNATPQETPFFTKTSVLLIRILYVTLFVGICLFLGHHYLVLVLALQVPSETLTWLILAGISFVIDVAYTLCKPLTIAVVFILTFFEEQFS